MGVSGLLTKADKHQKKADDDISVAFGDLEALMTKASEVVKLANVIALKLASSNDCIDEKSTRDFQSMLLELGISNAVTRELTGSAYHIELSRQLSEFSTKLLKKRDVHFISLADVYCFYNRARGTSLISPTEFYQATQLFDQYCLPVALKKLPSGLLVVKSRSLTESSLLEAIVDCIKGRDLIGVDASKISLFIKLNIETTFVYLRQAEACGLVCRDESFSGVLYYPNLFIE